MRITRNLLVSSIMSLSLGAALVGCGTSASPGAQNSSTSSGTANNSTAAGSNKTIKIGYINWSEDVAVSYLWKDLLTKHGYPTKLVNASAGLTFTGLKKNSVQLFMDAWLPHDHAPYWKKVKGSVQKVNSWYTSPTQEGFVVPTYVKNVNSIADLKTHASEFNNKIIGIEPSAGEMRIAATAIKAYGLPETLQSSSTPAMLSELKRAETNKTPIVVTLWSPHWAFAKWHLKYLSDPKKLFGPPDHIYTLANDTFAKNNPKVIGWLKKFQLSQKQIGSMENLINQDPNHPAKGVSQWESQNQSLIQSWFK